MSVPFATWLGEEVLAVLVAWVAQVLLLCKRQQAFSENGCLLGSTPRLVRACTILTNVGYMYLAEVIA